VQQPDSRRGQAASATRLPSIQFHEMTISDTLPALPLREKKRGAVAVRLWRAMLGPIVATATVLLIPSLSKTIEM
jgi:hypothetical protein